METIRKQLEELEQEFKVKATYLAQVTSTNDVARDPSYREADMVMAEMQSKGRGQRGSDWVSRPGESLTFSIVLKPAMLDAPRQFMLSIAVSLALSDTITGMGVEDVSVKWPNDIYIGDSKVAGILIENDIFGDKLSRSIVGIGLNVNQRKFPPELPNPTSMSLATGRDFSRGEILKLFYRRLSIRYSALISDYMASLLRDYHERLYLFEKEHTFRLPDGTEFQGIIRSVEPSGTLIVERADGTFKGFLFKEIFF